MTYGHMDWGSLLILVGRDDLQREMTIQDGRFPSPLLENLDSIAIEYLVFFPNFVSLRNIIFTQVIWTVSLRGNAIGKVEFGKSRSLLFSLHDVHDLSTFQTRLALPAIGCSIFPWPQIPVGGPARVENEILVQYSILLLQMLPYLAQASLNWYKTLSWHPSVEREILLEFYLIVRDK